MFEAVKFWLKNRAQYKKTEMIYEEMDEENYPIKRWEEDMDEKIRLGTKEEIAEWLEADIKRVPITYPKEILEEIRWLPLDPKTFPITHVYREARTYNCIVGFGNFPYIHVYYNPTFPICYFADIESFKKYYNAGIEPTIERTDLSHTFQDPYALKGGTSYRLPDGNAVKYFQYRRFLIKKYEEVSVNEIVRDPDTHHIITTKHRVATFCDIDKFLRYYKLGGEQHG